MLVTVGQALRDAPQNLIFERESHDSRFNGPVVKASDIDGKSLLEITNEIRAKLVRRDEVVRQLKGMGINV